MAREETLESLRMEIRRLRNELSIICAIPCPSPCPNCTTCNQEKQAMLNAARLALHPERRWKD